MKGNLRLKLNWITGTSWGSSVYLYFYESLNVEPELDLINSNLFKEINVTE